MNWQFWFFIVFAFLGIVVLIGRKAVNAEDDDIKKGGSTLAVILFVIAGIFLIFASVNQVPIRNVGIVTAFGRPTGEVTGSGLKVVAPWERVNDWDASVQTSDHTGPGCVTVRIGSLATACVENKVRWQVKPEAAPEQFMAYKGDFENMKKNLFETELQNALNEAFSDYNPLTSVNIATGQTTFDGTALSEEVKLLLQKRVGAQIGVESVVIPLVRHDGKTEENIKNFQDVIAQARILEQKQKNAGIEKTTAEIVASLPPQYTVNKCLDIAKELGKEPGLCLGGVTQTYPVK